MTINQVIEVLYQYDQFYRTKKAKKPLRMHDSGLGKTLKITSLHQMVRKFVKK